MIIANKIIKDHLESYQKSGLTKSEYCKLKGLKHSTFHTWYSKYIGVSSSINKLQKLNQFQEIKTIEERPKSFFKLTIDENFKVEFGLEISLWF
jgi:hypothetical protein